MSWSIRQIFEELVQLGESPRIEAKQANEIGPSVMQTICAFANEPGLDGGWLLLGIAEPDHGHDSFWVNGVQDIDNLLGALQNNCRNQFEQPISIECKHAKIDGKSVIGVLFMNWRQALSLVPLSANRTNIINAKQGYGGEGQMAIMSV